MKLSELILHVGDEHVAVQGLGSCVINAKTRKGGFTEVSFGTTHMSPGDLLTEGKMVGMIIWLPRDRLPADMQ